jgi:hypothetical protein
MDIFYMVIKKKYLEEQENIEDSSLLFASVVSKQEAYLTGAAFGV